MGAGALTLPLAVPVQGELDAPFFLLAGEQLVLPCPLALLLLLFLLLPRRPRLHGRAPCIVWQILIRHGTYVRAPRLSLLPAFWLPPGCFRPVCLAFLLLLQPLRWLLLHQAVTLLLLLLL
jgi:hypothetical protein